MKISIITPLFGLNRSKARQRNWKVVHSHLKWLLDSDEYDVEWIVPEQGSRFGNRYKTTKVSVFGKQSRAQMRNIGLDASSGDVIVFLDADVCMSPDDWRSALNEVVSGRSDAHSPYTHGYRLGKVQSSNRSDKIARNDWTFSFPPKSRQLWNMCGGILVVTREAIKAVQGWDPRFSGYGYEDIALEKLLKARFKCSSGKANPIHLWHPRGKVGAQSRRMRKKYRQHYAGKSYDAVMQSRTIKRHPYASRKIKGLTAVTGLSINPARYDRQKECLKSWDRIGLDTVVVVPKRDQKLVKEMFPERNVWDGDPTHDEVGRCFIKNYANMAHHLGNPVIVINSDIEIAQTQEDFIQQWVDVPPKNLQMGNRWDHDDLITNAVELPTGIDAFRFTAEMAHELPNLEFTIGGPCWDYWVPWHFAINGYTLRMDPRPVLLHKKHKVIWSNTDFHRTRHLLEKEYGILIGYVNEFIVQVAKPQGRICGQAVYDSSIDVERLSRQYGFKFNAKSSTQAAIELHVQDGGDCEGS